MPVLAFEVQRGFEAVAVNNVAFAGLEVVLKGGVPQVGAEAVVKMDIKSPVGGGLVGKARADAEIAFVEGA